MSTREMPTGVGGWTDERCRAVAVALAELIAVDPTFSAQVCAYHRGEPILDLWAGPDLGEDSLICVFSASKGLSAICLGMLIERGELDPEATVASVWPEFAAAGKETTTVSMLLSHQAGLPEVDGGLTWPELVDDRLAARRLAAQRPFWRPGIAWGYHSLTLGVLMNELCRRVTGRSLQEFYETEVRKPRDIECYLGLPESLEPRVSPVLVPELPPMPPTVLSSPQLGDLVVRLVYEPGFEVLANSREGHAAGIPAAGAVGSARGLAQLYASVGSDLGGGRLLSDETIGIMGQIRSEGTDLLSGLPHRFGLAFQKPSPERPFASYRAIGHDGAAGALGFYDPHDGVAYGFVTNRPAPPGGDRRADQLAAVIRSCIA